MKIGAIYHLNGSLSPLDFSSALDIQLAVKEINEHGGVSGKPERFILFDRKTNTPKI